MSVQWPRSLTLLIAASSLVANYFTTVLLSYLPKAYDAYYIAPSYSTYLHFANVFNIFALIAALRQHALSVLIYAHFLMIDSLVRSIPRFLLYMTFERYRQPLCMLSTDDSTPSNGPLNPEQSSDGISSGDLERWWKSFSSGLSPTTCGTVVWVFQAAFCVGILALTVLELLAALEVRVYVTRLNLRDRRQSRGVLAGETVGSSEGRRLDVVDGINETRFNVDEEKLI